MGVGDNEEEGEEMEVVLVEEVAAVVESRKCKDLGREKKKRGEEKTQIHQVNKQDEVRVPRNPHLKTNSPQLRVKKIFKADQTWRRTGSAAPAPRNKK